MKNLRVFVLLSLLLCVCLLFYRKRTKSLLAIHIHSVNVFCLWLLMSLLFCVVDVFFRVFWVVVCYGLSVWCCFLVVVCAVVAVVFLCLFCNRVLFFFPYEQIV